jgi:hypothetical protein
MSDPPENHRPRRAGSAPLFDLLQGAILGCPQLRMGRHPNFGILIRQKAKAGFDLAVSAEGFEFLVRRGIHKALGARPMRKTAQKFIGDAVRDAMKAGALSSGVLLVSPLNDRLMIIQLA